MLPRMQTDRLQSCESHWEIPGRRLSAQFRSRIRVQPRTDLSSGSNVTQDTHCCSCGEAMADVASATWVFKQPTIHKQHRLSAAWPPRGCVTLSDSTGQGCRHFSHANHLLWPNIKARLERALQEPTPEWVSFCTCLHTA